MKYSILFGALLVLFVGTTAFVAEPPAENEDVKWFTKLEEAQAVSKATNKPIFAFFTGSDWCGWCMRLQANVFHKPNFKQWANENVVLLELDYPKRKQLPADIAKQNNELRAFFKPRGFPTVWIFNMDFNEAEKQWHITALGNLGYPSSQPGMEEQTFIANANRVLSNAAKVPSQP